MPSIDIPIIQYKIYLNMPLSIFFKSKFIEYNKS